VTGAARYGEDLAAIHAAAFTRIATAGARELLRRVPGPARVLDLGCGDGTTARLLTAAGHAVHGIDASPHHIARARVTAPGATFAVADVLDPLPHAAYDAVVALGEVLGYATTAAPLGDALAAIRHTLRPGGLLLLDLAGPDRRPGRAWTEGPGWAVLAHGAVAGDRLTRTIVTYRDPTGDGTYRRGEERHVLRLHAPGAVLAALAAHGFPHAATLPGGYDDEPLPAGITAYAAT
jgi:SAM-dependent methyltransferase